MKDLKRKWTSLKNSFVKEQSKRKNLKSTPERKICSTFDYYDQMLFLSPCIGRQLMKSHCSNSNSAQITDGDSDVIYDSNDDDVTILSAQETRELNLRRRSSKRRRTDKTLSPSSVNREPQQIEGDLDHMFLYSLVDDFKQIPAPFKAQVKLSMMQAISNAHQLAYRQSLHHNLQFQIQKRVEFPTSHFTHHPQLHAFHAPRPNYQLSMHREHQQTSYHEQEVHTSTPFLRTPLSSLSHRMNEAETDLSHTSN